MNLFHKKTELSTIAIMKLILESGKNEVVNLLTFIDRVQINCSKDIVSINMLSINFELCRYELYKNNNHNIVDEVLDKVYDEYFYSLDNNKKDAYENIVSEVKEKCLEIFNTKKLLAPKEVFAYRLLLEQLSVKESSINNIFIQELLVLASRWVINAKNINKIYSIKADDNKKNDTIDFRF